MLRKILLALLLLLASIGAAEAKSGGPPVVPVPSTFWGSQPDFPAAAYPTAPVATGRLWSCETEGGIWQFVQPTSSASFTWTALDSCVAAYRQHGASLIYTFGGIPGWANSNAGRDVPPTGTAFTTFVGQLSTFATAVATRYRGQITYYECWNEINAGEGWWSGTDSQMLAMCQAEQSAVAAADPSACFITPSTTGASGLREAQTYLAQTGAPSGYCGLNFHSYAIFDPAVGQMPPEQNSTICLFYQDIGYLFALNNLPLITDEGGWGDGSIVNTSQLQEAYGAIWPILYSGCGVSRALWYQYDTSWGQQWSGSALTPGGQAFFTVQSWLNGATWNNPPARIAGSNGIRNPTATGAVAGTPGTLPTNWGGFFPDSGHGITTSIVGTGVENGIPYIDITIGGTATTGATGVTQINFDTIAASLGQQWTDCVYIRQVGGSNTNQVDSIEFQELNSSAGFLQSDASLKIIPLNTPLNLDLWCLGAKTTNASVAFVSPLLEVDYAVGTAFSTTLRIGLPSIDTGSLWSGTFTKSGGYQGEVIWDSASGPTSWTAPSWATFKTDYTGTKTAISGALSLTNVPIMVSNQ